MRSCPPGWRRWTGPAAAGHYNSKTVQQDVGRCESHDRHGLLPIITVDVRGQVDRAGFLSRPAVSSRARANHRVGWTSEGCSLGIGDELAVDDVGDPPLQAAHRFHRFLAGGALASVVGAAFVSRWIWVTAAMWIMWFIRRFPARESRWGLCSPDEASRGAVPVQDANRFRSANLVTSPTSARILAATTGPGVTNDGPADLDSVVVHRPVLGDVESRIVHPVAPSGLRR
jgi:hypothetical protein